LTKNLTFNELTLSDKIDLFYALCDYRLWCEDVTDALKDFTLEELRLESIGKDSQGYEYWYFSGTRLYRENKELSQDIILRKKRIKELEYNLIELEKTRIFREQEEKRRAELERAKQLTLEAREARLAAKKKHEQETSKKRKQTTPILPPRTGLRERRSSATSNNNDSRLFKTPPSRGKLESDSQPQSAQKTTRNLGRNSKHNAKSNETSLSSDSPKKSPEEECKDELERLTITAEDRAEAWCIQCESLEDWESFATKFEKTKSTNEKYLTANINELILPKIRAIYAKKAAEAKRKEKELLLSLSSRRVSTRIISRRVQEEEEERQAQMHEAEMRRKKVEAETRLRTELEREMRARRSRLIVNGGTSSTCSEDGDDVSRYNLRQHQQHQQHGNLDEFDGIIHPDNLSEFYEALELVIDTVRTSKHAWPFVDPVPETVHGYYDLISKPMDLKTLRTKVEFREYKSLIELEKDFQLLVNNCERFNGPKNVYTKMVYKLWKSFRKNVRLYLQRDLSMDEYETYIYPPPPKENPLKLEQARSTENVESSELVHSNGQAESTVLTQIVEPAVSNEQGTSQELGVPSESENGIEPTDSTRQESIVDSTKPFELIDTVIQIKSGVSISPMESIEPLKSLEHIDEPISAPPIPISEDIIIDSYDVPCPDDSFFIWSQDTKPT